MAIVLFDMDGTLTPARKRISNDVVSCLKNLSKIAKIGIVSGSGFNYIVEQCSDLWSEVGSVYPEDITLFPCNGTKMYTWKKMRWDLDFEARIQDEIGEDKFRKFISILLDLQCKFSKDYETIPMIGHFISYRGSMINWCPMGRDASFTYREDFVKKDKEYNIREDLISQLKQSLKENEIEGITIALGGNTSIDIYPKGWDKTFCLNHIDESEIWFVGDRCKKGENDYEIFKMLYKDDRSFQTSDPGVTISIVNDIIIPSIGESKR